MAWKTQGGIKTHDRKHFAEQGAERTACGRLRQGHYAQSIQVGGFRYQAMRVTHNREIAYRTVDCAQCIKAAGLASAGAA